MNILRLLSGVFLLVGLASGLAFGQAADDYRTAASGPWSAPATWERYSGTQWEPATVAPTDAVGAVSILSGHTISVASDVTVDSVAILPGGMVIIAPNVTLTVAYNADAIGIDVDSLGTLAVNGTVLCQGRVTGEPTGILFFQGSAYEHARNGGSVPRAQWQPGSTIRLTGVTANSPSNMNQNFSNLVIDCAGLSANLNMGMSGNTIGGDITVLRTGTSSRYYLTAPNAYVDPITINGNIYVRGGTFSSNGSSSTASIVVRTYGNVIVTAGNFGCSRGSGPSVSWYLYGDSMVVSNATLQNSTSSPDRIQKFIFAKTGTQYLRWSNVAYSTGTSPVTLQVLGGTTLDIGTTHITSSNTGSFLLDSAATLVSAHNGPGDEGTIECLGDLGGYNTFVDISATAGTGNTEVTAYGGTHPNAYDPEKMLRRYWTISADAGITEATLKLYYHDYGFSPAESDVRGTETAYKALRYLDSGTNWYTESGSTVDAEFDFVTASGVTTINGTWSAGETAPTAVAVPEGEIPESFTVDQNYPNPFNPGTTIAYGLPNDEWVSVKVYNLIGHEVATLFEGQQRAGMHRVAFDGASLPTGIYVYRVQAGKAESVRRMMLLK